nr:IS701 family transposase [Pseudonocardia humida]
MELHVGRTTADRCAACQPHQEGQQRTCMSPTMPGQCDRFLNRVSQVRILPGAPLSDLTKPALHLLKQEGGRSCSVRLCPAVSEAWRLSVPVLCPRRARAAPATQGGRDSRDVVTDTVNDADGVRDDLRAYAVEHLGEPGAVLIVDETGFLKKGLKSAGVQRQYSGTAGRIENCQLGVFLAYATPKGRTLIDRELYLPKSWIADTARRREAAVPEQAEFATKAVLAQRMLARALDAGVPAGWVAADEAYGQDYKFRTWCEHNKIGYVVAVPRSQSVPLPLDAGFSLGSRRADDLVAQAPAQAWKRRSAGPGAKGERLYDWAVASLYPSEHTPPGWGRWLLARRQILTTEQVEQGKTRRSPTTCAPARPAPSMRT